jgi:formate-dependent nitrite reductase membrane component NrfD
LDRDDELIMIISWNYIITFYLFTAGISAGAFMISAAAEILDQKNERYKEIINIGAYIAPFPISLGIACLVLDLERPLYFWKLLITFQYTSVMSIGSWILVLFCGISYLNLYLKYKDNAANKIMTIIGLILSIGVAVYTGILISILIARPLWHSPMIPIIFFISAVIDGIAAICLGMLYIRKTMSHDEYLRNKKILYSIDIPCLILLIISVIIYIYTVNIDAVKVIISGQYAIYFWVFVVLTGMLMPLIYETWMIRNHTSTKHYVQISIVIGLLILFGGYMLRYVIIYGGQASSVIFYQ